LGRTNFPSAFQNRKCIYDIFKAAVLYEGKLNTSNRLVKKNCIFHGFLLQISVSRMEILRDCHIKHIHTYRAQQMQSYELQRKNHNVYQQWAQSFRLRVHLLFSFSYKVRPVWPHSGGKKNYKHQPLNQQPLICINLNIITLHKYCRLIVFFVD
jgi:hypothetical protein